ncbi:hypothetical protein DV735_g4990, partial [Chaetothyriales sp. CBS 134920]
MDPRQTLSRQPSAAQPPNSYSTANPMATSYSMPAPSYQNNALPPINYQGLPGGNQATYPSYPRYPSSTAPGGPSPTPDRYNPAMPHQAGLQGLPPASMLPQPQQGQQSDYPNSQTPPVTRPGGYQQPLAPAPPRPNMDAMGSSYPHPDQRQPWSTPEGMPGLAPDVGRDQPRTHVVGSQGRRGILPSAPGRPPVSQNGLNGSPKGGQIPQKDADGKFPCPNCTKTYLHAKHLKRHMLRRETALLAPPLNPAGRLLTCNADTGDRPYMCVLCNDTFSRSDILKRHFQKCSVRRGNPTGASHLSNPAAHLKKSQAAAAKAAANAAGNASPGGASTPVSAGIPSSAYTTTSMPQSSIPATAPGQPTSSIAYGINSSQLDIQRQQQGQGLPSNPQAGPLDQNSGNQWGIQNAREQQMIYSQNHGQHYGIQPPEGDEKRNIPAGHHMGDEWNQMFPAGGNEHYINPMFSGYGQSHGDVKTESHESQSNGYYIPPTSLGADGTSGPLWQSDTLPLSAPLQVLADRLVDFCFPQESPRERRNNHVIRSCLNADTIQHFLVLFSHFQGHFPYIHLPTLKLDQIYPGLLLLIICHGAVYSDLVPQAHVRALTLEANSAIERTARLLRPAPSLDSVSHLSNSAVEYEELMALILLFNLMIWHGGPVERAAGRNQSRQLCDLARRLNMLRLTGADEPHVFSHLHNLGPRQVAQPTQFNWSSWVEQEKRIRLMFAVFLTNAALAIFFNVEPAFDALEIKLPMPADDAAWDALDGEACAQALGLRGSEVQAAVNPAGSRRLKSVCFDHAIHALCNPSAAIEPRSTNPYSKFVMIHALHIKIWKLQRERPRDPSARETFKAIRTALVRWKQCWDQDMRLQYPQPGTPRLGFCRDSTPFWWLARAFLQPNRQHDWQLAPDDKLRLTMKGLDQARVWSQTDGAERGEEPGSVALIDPSYSTPEDLVLDMRKLFRPLNKDEPQVCGNELNSLPSYPNAANQPQPTTLVMG